MLVTGLPLIVDGIVTDVADVLHPVIVTSPFDRVYVRSPYVSAEAFTVNSAVTARMKQVTSVSLNIRLFIVCPRFDRFFSCITILLLPERYVKNK